MFKELSVSITEEVARNFLNRMHDTDDKMKTKYFEEALEILGLNDLILEGTLHEQPKAAFHFLNYK